MGAPVCAAALMMRHHGDVYMTSQPIAALSSAAGRGLRGVAAKV